MILTVGSTKGGVGKTIFATNFVIGLVERGQDVLLIDGDDQGHAMIFTELRAAARPDEGLGFTAVKLMGNEIRTQAPQLKKRYDHIVIDVGGRDTPSLRGALLVSDMVVIPTRPRSFDLWGAESTGELVEIARASGNEKLKALAVINFAAARGSANDDALGLLKDCEGLKVSDVLIGNRTAYSNAASRGLGISEFSDRNDRIGVQKAQEDFQRLFQTIYPRLERKIA